MTPLPHRPSSTYRFADLTLDTARRTVARNGQRIVLKALDFDLLRFLVEQGPNVVNADVLAEKVWGRHFVSPENVAQRVMLLRQCLSDDANRPRYIETIRNKGYRLIPLVESVPAEAPRAAPRRRWSVSATIAVSFVTVAFTASGAYWLAGTTKRDIRAIQSDIAHDVAQALRLELTAAERERVEQVPTTNPRARDLYLRASARDPTERDEMLRALAELDQALALDPKFKEALLFDSVIRSAYAPFLDPEHVEEHRRRGEQSLRRALDIDPQLGEGHVALGLLLHTRGDWTGAEDAFRKAQSLNVPWAELGPYAFLQLSVGKLDGLARDIFESARAAEPTNPLYYRFLAFLHEASGERSRANDFYENGASLFRGDEREAVQMLEQRMHWRVGRGELAEARAMTMADPLNSAMLAMLDHPDRALAELRRVYDTSLPGNPTLRRTVALWAGHFGAPALALTAMRATTEQQGAQAPYLWMPQLREMRQLPAFKTYMRDIGMVAYWREYGWPDQFCRPLGERDFECR